MSEAIDLAIVGGGPAGMAAVEVAADAGLSVAIVDEQQRLGGQILRQPPKAFHVPGWLPGRGYAGVKAQLERAETLPVAIHAGMSVHSAYRNADGGFDLMLAGAGGGRRLRARRLLVATGCYDMPVAFPGWTLPGVTSAGAVQAFIKSQQLVPGERFVLAGTHPLQLILADQIVQAGGQVAAVLFAQPAARALGMVGMPGTALAHLPILATAASAIARLKKAGVPIRFDRILVAASGEDEVTAARIAAPGDRDGEDMPCDRIATCYGFLPQSDLPRALGAVAIALPRTGGWRIEHDDWMRSSIDALSVAGEITGVAGAQVSMLEGRLAGLGVALDAGRLDRAEAERRARPIRRQLASGRRFATLLDAVADPSPFWPGLADPGRILCRCEDVTRQTIEAEIAARPLAGAGSIKRATRIGMGRCQGRGCEHQLLAMMQASAATEGFAARMPVRPVPIAAILQADPPA